ncbi:MAG TPA: hypothetical protein VK633_01780, partial [Verrucomicrobiae bacterium]|nr:hypothetical protein [Verrucomicrobiae bacterium]
MKLRRIVRLGVFALYLALVSFAPVLDHLVLFPSTERIPAGAATRKAVPFEGGEVEVWTAAS